MYNCIYDVAVLQVIQVHNSELHSIEFLLLYTFIYIHIRVSTYNIICKSVHRGYYDCEFDDASTSSSGVKRLRFFV